MARRALLLVLLSACAVNADGLVGGDAGHEVLIDATSFDQGSSRDTSPSHDTMKPRDALVSHDVTTPVDAPLTHDAPAPHDALTHDAPAPHDATSQDAPHEDAKNDAPSSRDAHPEDARHDALHDTGTPHDAPVEAKAPTCTDGVKDGNETGVDCGGGTCPPCADTLGCKVATDCESGVCTDDVCASPACAPSCGDGTACGANDDCGSEVCTAGVCATPTCSPTCADKAPCGGNYDCASEVCNGGKCASVVGESCTTNEGCASGYCKSDVCTSTTSCSALLAVSSATPSGAWIIDVDGSGPKPPFAVYCDMKDQGGGWTLVAKMGTVASPGTFEYTSGYWTNGMLLNAASTNMSQQQALFQSYLSVPFTNILAMMTSLASTTTPNMLVVPLADTTSLSHLIALNTYAPTTLGTNAWTGLSVPTAQLQPNCNMEGVDVQATCAGSSSARVRLGLIANNENDCCSSDSYVGFGGEYDATSCNPVSESAGSMGGGGALSDCGGSEQNVQDFGYIFVR